MSSLRSFDEAIWASAAETLGLAMHMRGEAPKHADSFEELTRGLGPRIARSDATTEHWMVGERGDLGIVARHGGGAGTGGVIVTIGFRRPLRLGLCSPRRAAVAGQHGQLMPMPSLTDVHRVRVRPLVVGSEAPAMAAALGALGWQALLSIADTFIEVSRIGMPEGAAWHVTVIERALELAALVRAARSALPPPPWEAALENRWSATANTEMSFDADRLVLEGTYARLDARLWLVIGEEITETHATLGLGRTLGAELRVFPQTARSKLRSFFGKGDIRTGDAPFDEALIVSGASADQVRALLGGEARRLLLELMQRGAAIDLDDERLAVVLADVVIDPAPLLESMLAAARALTRVDATRSPYR